MAKNNYKSILLNEVVTNKNILIFFTFFYLIFSFYTINQFSVGLNNTDFYKYLFGDGDNHIRLINNIDKKLTFKKIHYAGLYYNNYYIFSLAVLKILKFFPGFDYTLIGLSAVIINLISIYIICVTGYLISFQLSNSKILSLGIILLLWNSDLIIFGLRIYPDILQLAFIFIAIYFLCLENKYKWFFSFIFCGLAFGVKGQGLLIFLYIIIVYFIHELGDNSTHKLKFDKVLTTSFKSFFYGALFLIAFFALNQIDPIALTKNILSFTQSKGVTHEYDNIKIVYKYFKFLLRHAYGIYIFISFIFFGIIFSFFQTKKQVFLYITIFVLIIFYFQVVNLSILVQGPRYLYHLLPLMMIVISISYDNISYYLKLKKIGIISIAISFFIFVYGVNQFYYTFFNSIQRINFKTKIKNDPMFKGYNYFLSQSFNNKKEPLVCAGHYSLVPSSLSKKISKSYRHLDFEKQIKKKECDYIVLDSSTPGRYIWFKKDLNNLIITKYENLSAYMKLYGKEKIEKTQNLIQYILKDPNSGYEVKFFNSRIIILQKK